MRINTVKVQNEGFVYCKSRFYSAQDVLSDRSVYNFSTGINKLIGDIDSGNWAISYLLSMFKHRSEDFILFKQPVVVINDKCLTLEEVSEFSCYMDKLYPPFFTNDSVKTLVSQALDYSKINCSISNVKKLFELDNERFERPLSQVGNEIFRAMAAVGYCYGKEIFCFPWMSKRRFESYRENLSVTLKILDELKKIVIIPIGVG